MKNALISSGMVVRKTIDELQKFAPWAQDIQVKITKGPRGMYHTLIEVKAKRRKLTAAKDENSPLKCLAKTRLAMIKQIERLHANRLHDVQGKALLKSAF